MSMTSRQRANSIFVYLIFGILIAVFIISFGPQRVAVGQGCGASSAVEVGKVEGTHFTVNDWRFAWGLTDGNGRGRTAMTNLIRRELLANEAAERGYRVNDDTVDASIAAGKLYFGGNLVANEVAMVPSGATKYFSFDTLSRIANQNFGGVGNYRAQQRRELLAHIAEAERQFGLVATDEARALYTIQNSYVNLEYVRFSHTAFGKALRLGPADVARFLATHDAEVKAAYDDNKASYTQTPPRKKLRLLRVAKGTDAAAGKAVAERARARVVAKQATFEAVIAEVATTKEDAAAGDLGWRDIATPMLATDALNTAVGTLNPGDLSEVIEGDDAYYVLAVEGARQGDLSFDDVKLELAEREARRVWGKEAARKAALEAAAAIAGGKSLDGLFKKKDEAVVGRSVWESPITLAQSGGTATMPQAAATVPQAATNATDPMRPVTEVLPALTTAVVPALESRLMVRRAADGLQGFGDSIALANVVFNDLSAGQTAPAIYPAGDDFVIVRLIGKSAVEETKLAAEAEAFADELAKVRGAEAVSDALQARCAQATERKEISINPALLHDSQEGEDGGAMAPPVFSPCAGL